MSGQIFAIDIRHNGISGLLIKNSLKGNRIEAQRYIPYADSKNEQVLSEARIADAIKNVVKDLDLSGCEYVVSISSEFISYRNLQVPFKDRKKIRQILPFELEPTLPYAIEDLKVDFQMIRQAEHTDVFVGALNNAMIESLMADLKENNIAPRIVTPSGLPSALCLSRFSAVHKDFIFVDIDEIYCTVFAIVSGHVRLARSFVAKSSDPMLQQKQLVDRIAQTLTAFESLFLIDFEPSIVFISGVFTSGNDLIEDDFQQTLNSVLGVPVQQADILSEVNLNLSFASDIHFNHDLLNNTLSLAVVEILGISTINFFGERSIARKYWEEYKNDFIKTGLTAAFVFVIAMFNVLFDAHFLQKEVNQLNQQIAGIFQATLPDVTKIVDPLQQMRIRLAQEQKKNLFTGEMGEETLNIDILNDISSLIPNQLDVEFTRFVRGDKNLLISGNTDTFNSVDEIKVKLARAKTIKNITISSANLEKTSNRIQFKLKIDL
ncbi:MAG: hypothetical protein ACKVE4_01455 [Dissulfuribacterales bacterium]